MTAQTRYLTDHEEYLRLWPQLWRLIDGYQQHHANLTGLPLRPNRAEKAFEDYDPGRTRAGYWLQIAEDGSAVTGIGTASILPKGVSTDGPVGYTSTSYLAPAARGGGLGWRMLREREETLRDHGMRVRESSVLGTNERVFNAFGDDTWGCSLRRPLRDLPGAQPGLIRRIRDLDQEWPVLWPLLQKTGLQDETSERTRIAAVFERRGAAFIAGEPPEGVIIGRIEVNPWLFTERTGLITDLRTLPGSEAAEALLVRMEHWMTGKDAVDVQTGFLPHSETTAWLERGFRPYTYRRSVSLEEDPSARRRSAWP